MAEEMHNFYQEEDLYTYIDGSTPSLDQASYSGIPGEEDGLVLVTKQESEGQTKGADVQTAKSFEDGGDINQKSVHSIGIGDNVQMSEVGIQNSPQTLMRSISTQGSNGYSSSFEETVLAILRGLSDRMTEMKSNPTTTQKEIIEQEKVQHQMIQSMISMSLNDPAIMKSLQAMLKEQAMESTQPQVMKRRSSTAFEELQSKLLLAQEEQLRETKEHFQTQAEFQTAIQKRLEEQAQQQMKGIQSNFEIYSKKLEDQLAEHYRQWDEELRKRREEEKSSKKRKSREKRNKKHRKMKHNQTSESSSSDSDEGLVHMPLSKTNKPKTVNFHPAIKTMEAKIFTQRLLDDDEMETESQISIEKIKEKHEARGKLMRKNTSMQLDDTREAMRRYEARHPDHLHIHSEDEDDEDMMQFQHIRPVTLKRAEIKTQSGTGFTPARPEPTITGKVGRIQRIELGGTRETGQSRKYDRHKK